MYCKPRGFRWGITQEGGGAKKKEMKHERGWRGEEKFRVRI
jgi:hypothetical protein